MELFEQNTDSKFTLGNKTEDSKKYLISGVPSTIPKLTYKRSIKKFLFNTAKYKHVIYLLSNKPEFYDFLSLFRKNCFSIKPNFIVFNQTFKVSNSTIKISNITNRKLITNADYIPINYNSANGNQKVLVSDVTGIIKFLFTRYQPTSKNMIDFNIDLFELQNYIPSYVIYLDDNIDAPVWLYKFLFNLYIKLIRLNYIPDVNILLYQESTKKFFVINTIDADQNTSMYRSALTMALKIVHDNLDSESKKSEQIKKLKEKVVNALQVSDDSVDTILMSLDNVTNEKIEKIEKTNKPEEVASELHQSILKKVSPGIEPNYKNQDIEKARRYASLKYIFLDSNHLNIEKMIEKIQENTPIPIKHISQNYYKNNVGHGILNHLKQSYESSFDMLDQLVKKAVESLGFQIIEKVVEDRKYDILGNTVTDGHVVTYTIKDSRGVTHTFELFLPKVYDNGIIRINNNDYILNTQLFPTPIKGKNNTELRFQTLTNLVKIYRSSRSISCEIAGVKIPVGILFMYMKSFDEMSRVLNFKYNILTKDEPVDKKDGKFKIGKDRYIVIRDYENLSNGTKLILQGTFKYIEKYADKIDGEPFSYEWIQKLLGTFRNFDINTYLKPILNNLIDPITEQYLKQIGYINDTANTLLELSRDFGDTPEKFIVKRNDIRYYRVRTYEQIANFYANTIFQELLTVHNNIQRFKDYKPKPTVMKVSQSIAKLISGQPILRLLEYQNPLEEYVNFFKVTYGGYLGIRNENVPIDARSVLKEAKGTVDPVDTPEGQNTGATQTLSNSHRIITQTGLISIYDSKDKLKGSLLGPSLSLVPFGRFSEPTRLLITSNQIKQPLSIKESEPPALMTGFEPIVGYNSSFSTKIAKKDGEVIYSGKDRIEIRYKDGEIDKISLEPIMLRSGQGYYVKLHYYTELKKGDKVKEGQIIAHSDFVDENGIYRYGKNILVAFMQFPGTYEDGIVVSKEIINSYTSKHTQRYKLYLSTNDSLVEFKIDEIGQKVNAGEQIIKVLSNTYMDYINSELFEGVELDYTINGYSVINKIEGHVTDVKIVASQSFLKNVRSDVLPKVKKFMKMSNEVVYYKQKPLDGMYIEIYIDYEMPLQVGDKLVSRHANKGVVSRILPKEKMPVIVDTGEHIEMIFSPASIVDRTITALLYEIYINMISEKLASLIKKNNYSIEKSFTYIKLLENFDSKETNGFYSNYVASIMSNKKTKEFVINFVKNYKMFPIIIPSFMEPTVEQISKVMKTLGINSKRKVRLESGHEVEVVAGKLYVLKLEHLSFKKLSSRSIGAYNAFGSAIGKTDKGQKVSELDTLSFVSWDIPEILKEINLDSPVAKRKIYEQIIWKDSVTLEDTINSLPRELQEEYRQSTQGMRVMLQGALLDI